MMSSGEVTAWHYRTREPVRVRWLKGVFSELSVASKPPAENIWIAAPLLDLQVNGFGGLDFQQDTLSGRQLLTATNSLRSAGCVRFFPTLVTDDWPKLTSRLRRLVALRAEWPELESAIAGWHIEGPFLSTEPGFHGAHDPTRMCDPTPEKIAELRSITGGDPLLLTLSPERAGAIEAIRFAVSQGIKVSLGHTNASFEIVREAVQAGAAGFTHFGNGCPRELDRHDNIFWRIFETPGLMIGIIPDKIHVSPRLFRLMHRMVPSDKIYYTSDAMAAAGAGPGRYRLGALELEVGPDQVVRQPGKQLFAGSALRPVDGVFRAAEMLGSAWQESWQRFSDAPARFMGINNEITAGERANFCLLRLNKRDELIDLKTSVNGAGLNPSD
jgi:N-acetylglucosamine-6-phosphate deacetylase